MVSNQRFLCNPLRYCRFQFSIKAIFVFFVLTGLMLSIVISRKNLQNQVESLAKLKGGWVSNVDIDDSLRGYPELPEFIPDSLYWYLPRRLNYVYAASIEFGDTDVDVIVKLPGLRGVNLSESSITEASLQKLAECKTLVYVQLFGINWVTNDHINKLKMLRPALHVVR